MAEASALERIEMEITVAAGVAVIELRIHKTLSDHVLRLFFIVFPLFLFVFAFQADRLMIIYRKDPLVGRLHVSAAPLAFEGAV
jgi:hypothetical protein